MSCQSYNPLQFHMHLSSSHQPPATSQAGKGCQDDYSFGRPTARLHLETKTTKWKNLLAKLILASAWWCSFELRAQPTLVARKLSVWNESNEKKELISKTNTDGNTRDRLADRRSHLVTTFVEFQGTHIWVSDTKKTSNWHECLDHGENCAIIATIDNIQNTKTTSTIQFNFSPATGRWPAMQAARQTDRQMCKSGAVRFRSFQKSIPCHTDNRRQLQFPA